MRRFIRYLLPGALVTLLLAGGGAWIVLTPSGARLFLAAFSALTPLNIEPASVAGRLADDLRLEKVAVEWSGGSARVGRIRLLWRPELLLQGTLAVEELILADGEVRLRKKPEEPKRPPDLSFPEVPSFLLRREGRVGEMRLDRFVFHPPEGKPAEVHRAGLSLRWGEGVLKLDDFALSTPQGKVEGEASVDFVGPALKVTMGAKGSEPLRGIDRVALEVNLKPAPGPRHLKGPLEAAASEGKRERARLEAEIDWTRDRFALPEIRLFRPGAKGEITGGASVTASAGWPFDLSLRAADVDLAPETGIPTDLSGEVAASGTTEKYRGRFSVANSVPGPKGGKAAGNFAGTAEEIVLSDFAGEWLRGSLRGNAAAGWEKGWSVRGALSGRGLDPSVVTAEWPGRVSFDLRAAASGGGETPLAAEVEGKLLDSTLRGRLLTGEMDASLKGEDLEIARFLLKGDGFDLSAQGRLRQRISFRAEIPRLGGLVPEARGSAAAKGWVRWREKHLSGALNAGGKGIVVGATRVSRFSMKAEHPEKGAPFFVAADLQGAAAAGIQVQSAEVDARGTLEKHSMRATVGGDDLRLRFSARGGYSQGVWAGTVAEMETGGRLPGRWTLAAPAPVELSRERLRVPPFRLDGPGEERLRVGADLALSPRRGTVEGEWRQIDLARANPWIGEIALAGRSSGSLKVRWLDGERLDLRAEGRAAGSARSEGRRLTVEDARGSLTWGPTGLKGALKADLGRVGSLEGRVSSAEPAGGTFIPARGEGEGKWNLSDLTPLSPFLPGIDLAGRSSGRLGGRWNEEGPLALSGKGEMTGRIAWDRLRLDVPRAQLEFDGGPKGVAASWSVDLGKRGETRGSASSDEPLRKALPTQGELNARWKGIDLALLEPWLEEMSVAGRTTGELRARGGRDRTFAVEGRVELGARLAQGDATLEIPRAGAQIRWDAEGLRARWDVSLAPLGKLTGEATSPEPARLEIPERGRAKARWEGIDLARLRPWLPPNLLLEGTLAGEVDGELLPERRLAVAGSARIEAGELQWLGEDGVLTASLRQAEARVDWRGESLTGGVALALQDYGRANANFRVPLPARIPVALRPEGPLAGTLTASLQERGLLNALFPGLVQESQGRLAVDLRVGGTWNRPDLGGEIALSDAAAYLPSAGIRLQEVRLRASLAGEEIRVSEFGARSGKGRVEGIGVVRLKEWRPLDYRLQVRGKDFQAVNLPELRLLVTPDLTVEGAPERVAVRGEVLIPEMLVSGRETDPPVEPSPDVVIVDAPVKQRKESPLGLDVQVRIVLGEHVLVKAEGIDARLEGGVRLTMTGLDPGRITARGEIRVAQGKYSTYGVTLDITRGVILFAGGPVDRPTLDILALRKAGEVRAGVRLTGTPRKPVVKLYSEPSLPDTDILSYMVLGRPLGGGAEGGNAGLLMLAANQLLSRGESAVLQDRIKQTLGIDVLEVESGGGETAGARITVGKYLNPDLYISFGQSLFTNTQEVRLRYNLTRNWQLESSVGTESAVDLFYNIEFR